MKIILSDLGIKREDCYSFNDEIFKVDYKKYQDLPLKGHLILVTALTPTKYGEGKTTVSIGLADSMNHLSYKTVLSLREPSLGPCFGTKGGAIGGGKSSLVPGERINMHFTGDFDNVTTINNLISSAIDNEVYFNSSLNVDPSRTTFHRCLDVCDRFLKDVELFVRRKKSPNIDYKTSFVITAASEIMGIFTLAQNEEDFKERIENIVFGFSTSDEKLTVKQLNITGAIMRLAKEMLMPNLVKTLENTPCFVHSGPFANIATGTSSAISLRLSLQLGDYVITECGFGADLGFEKYIDVVSRNNKIYPEVCVLVVTLRAILEHGNQDVKLGFENVLKHYNNIISTNLNCVIAINKFNNDDEEQLKVLESLLKENNMQFAYCEGFAKGKLGSLELAELVVKSLEKKELKPFYDIEDSIKTKIEKVATKVYGCKDVVYSEKAEEDIKLIEKLGFSNFYICMAKTPNSFTDDPKVLGRGDGSTLHIQKVEFNSGSKLVIPYSGEIILMPGLSKDPLMKHMEDFEWLS